MHAVQVMSWVVAHVTARDMYCTAEQAVWHSVLAWFTPVVSEVAEHVWQVRSLVGVGSSTGGEAAYVRGRVARASQVLVRSAAGGRGVAQRTCAVLRRVASAATAKERGQQGRLCM